MSEGNLMEEAMERRHPIFTGKVPDIPDPAALKFNVNVRDRRGATLAHYAAARGNIPVLEILEEAGADWNVPDIAGETPAHWAARNLRPEIVRLLSGKGALMSAANEQGITVMEMVAAMFLVEYPRESGCGPETRVPFATDIDHAQDIEMSAKVKDAAP